MPEESIRRKTFRIYSDDQRIFNDLKRSLGFKSDSHTMRFLLRYFQALKENGRLGEKSYLFYRVMSDLNRLHTGSDGRHMRHDSKTWKNHQA